MNFRKTSNNKRSTYKYFDYNGKLIKEVKAGEDGVNELNIQELHRMDDCDIYSFYKNARPNRTKEEKEAIEKWKKKYSKDFVEKYGYEPYQSDVKAEIDEQFPRNYNLSLNAFDEECEDGKNPIYSMIANVSTDEDVTEEMYQVEVAEKLGVYKQAVNKSWSNVKKKIKELF